MLEFVMPFDVSKSCTAFSILGGAQFLASRDRSDDWRTAIRR